MKSIKAYIALREDLERQREHIGDLIISLDSHYGIGSRERTVVRGLRKVAQKTKETTYRANEGSGASPRRAEVLNYLDEHPGSKAIAIAAALGISRSALYWHLNHARRDRVVKMQGRGAAAIWSRR